MLPFLFFFRVMDFIHGTPLTRLKEKMVERGIAEGSPEAAVFSRRLLASLTEAFSRMVFGDGFLHGGTSYVYACSLVFPPFGVLLF